MPRALGVNAYPPGVNCDSGRVQPSLISDIEGVARSLGVFLSAFIAKFLYLDLSSEVSGPVSVYLAVGALAALFLTLLSSAFRINDPAALLSNELQYKQLLAAVTLTFLLLVCFFYYLKVSDAFSRGWLAVWYGLSVGSALLIRIGVLSWVQRLQAQERLVQRIAIYGRLELACEVAHKLGPADGRRIVADIYSDDAKRISDENARVSGGMDQLIDKAQLEAFDLVIIALPASADAEIRKVASTLEMLPVDVQFSPGAISFPSRAPTAKDDTDSLVLLDLQKRPLRGRDALLKSAMDLVVATAALVALAPLMMATAIAIKLDSRGPVFFVQRRHGYNNRIVRVTKFRTMTVAQDGHDVPQAVRGDKRVTRLGRLLRKTSLDELPQLFDVLRGNLSLVGPRPHAVSHNEHYARILKRYVTRHKVKPGITGWAQVNGWRGETSDTEAMRQRLECDLFYIDNWSIWLDLRILARTLLVPFNSSNAY